MKTRVISSVIIGILLLVVLKSGGYILAAVLCAVSFVGFKELTSALGIAESKLMTVGYAGIILHYALMIYGLTTGNLRYDLIGASMFVLCGMAFIYVIYYPAIPVQKVIEVFFAFIYSAVIISFIYLLRILPHGSALVWVPFDAWMCDMGAYLAGRWFGKHKLAPELSPKKTIEGAIGGALVAGVTGTVFGFLMAYVWKVYSPALILPLTFVGLVTGIISQFGDLFASGIKRDRGIKDYGSLIPGHGGIMDRFDSVIFVTPAVYVMVRFFVI